MTKLFFQQLAARGTVLTALVVGTLINVYGQILVPCLRGGGAVLKDLRRNFVEAPLLALVSIGLGYAFPMIVSAFASTRARLEMGAIASLARFPDLKPDPVFRADRAGSIVEAGARTRTLFASCSVGRAQDLLGAEAWERIASAVDRDGRLAEAETAYCAPLAGVYLVTAAKAPDGINVYLSVVPRAERDRPQSRVA